MPRKHLTDKRKKFVREYLIDLNGKKAAIRAGYAPENADIEAVRLLGDASVSAEIDKATAQFAAKGTVKKEEIVRQLRLIAFSNIEDFTVKNGHTRVLDLSACDRDKLAAIGEITEDATGGSGDGEKRLVLRTKVRFKDQVKALELLSRHLGILHDKTEHSGNVSLTSLSDEELEARRKKLLGLP